MLDNFRWTKESEKRNDLTRTYEPIQIDLLRSLVRRCARAVFLDIGANVGAYSVAIASEEQVSEAHAFEPVDSLVQELSQNLIINGLERKVLIHPVILSDSSGVEEFLVRSEFAGDSGVMETHLFKHLPYAGIARLPKSSLDATLNVSSRDIVAKIDVEGHELKVLHGAQRFLRSNHGFIQVEILKEELRVPVEEFLDDCGWFPLFRVDRDFYFTNRSEYRSAESKLAAFEIGIASFISRVRSGDGAPYRKRIWRGVVIEVTKSYGETIKRLIGRTRRG